MCTVTWLKGDDSYQVFFNRDELKTRRIGVPPAEKKLSGVVFAAPKDPDGGGTWIAANEFGLTLCLVNHHPAPAPTADRHSRGLIIASHIDARSVDEVTSRLRSEDLGVYSPFKLLAFEAGVAPVLVFFDGATLVEKTLLDEDMPITSSSRDPAGVEARRHALFADLAVAGGLATAALERFHASHGTGPSAYSPCMHRSDAVTVSTTRVDVTPSDVKMSYSAGPPCETQVSTICLLARRRVIASVQPG